MRKLLVSSFLSLDGVVESPMTWPLPSLDEPGTSRKNRSSRWTGG
jgi:hypothetical protein